jgi:hypothetical protein
MPPVTAHPSPRFVTHPRSDDEIAVLLGELLDGAMFGVAGADPSRDTLIRIAARYGEIVTASLNASPDRHLDTFASLLGRHGRTAAAASVHLSFIPAASPSGKPVPVPAHTRVAGQASGSGDPPVFETLTDVALVPVEPLQALLFDAGHRWVTKLSTADLRPSPPVAPSPVPYELHIGHQPAFGVAGLRQVKVSLGIRDPGVAAGRSDWIVRLPDGDRVLSVESDTTGGLAHTDETVLVAPADWPATTIDGVEARWLTLRLKPERSAPGQWRPPLFSAVSIHVVAANVAQPVSAAFHDGMMIDTSKDFLPFGDRPRFGSVLQLVCPAFVEPGAKVEVHLQLTNPAGASASPVQPVSRNGNPVVFWEISTATGVRRLDAGDGTHSLTQSGSISFTVPNDVAPMAIAGKQAIWLRGRLAGGHYGSILPSEGPPIPIPLAPLVRSLAVQSTLELGPLLPEYLVSHGAWTTKRLDPALPLPAEAFPTTDAKGPALYIGLGTLGHPDPWDVLAECRSLAWHVVPALPDPPLVYRETPRRPDPPRWQMRCAGGWRDMETHDKSAGMTQSGIVRVTVPPNPTCWPGVMPGKATPKLAWIRIVWPADRSPELPLALTINSVDARHSQRLLNEIVGSSASRPDQVFTALRTPIIDAVRLQVRETEDDWVDWTEVESLALGNHVNRFFTLDRSTGKICFGDGRNGRIPPAGPNNIRLLQYSTGGGRSGNQPAAALAQLRSAVPAVASVTNHEPATGGLDADDPVRVRANGSVWLRHRGRAVGADDFADLAGQASSEVARAFCVPVRDLGAATPGATEPGVVSLIVIPHGADPTPQPRLDLLERVKTYLDERRAPAGRLVVVGPSYSRVMVRSQVAPADGWSPDEVVAACRERLAAFLHPINGGPDQCGWAPGRRPHRSDIYGLLDAMDCVDFVRSLSMSIDTPGAMPVIVAAGIIDVQTCDPQ